MKYIDVDKPKAGDTVVVGMSGGVDSTLVVKLLKERGCRVIGVTMSLWKGDLPPLPDGRILRASCYGPDETRWKTAFTDTGLTHRLICYYGDYEEVDSFGLQPGIPVTATAKYHWLPGDVLYVKQGGVGRLYYLATDHLGSIRDDFDFGALWLVKTSLLHTFAMQAGEHDYQYAAFYALRLCALHVALKKPSTCGHVRLQKIGLPGGQRRVVRQHHRNGVRERALGERTVWHDGRHKACRAQRGGHSVGIPHAPHSLIAAA